MSARPVVRTIGDLREATTQAAWLQWSAIFSIASTRRTARAIVDPEALLLGSLALREHEPRLWTAAVSWAQVGARLLSVQRVKNLVGRFPDSVRQSLGDFARLATAGGDQRWKTVLAPGGRSPSVRERPKPAVLRIETGPTLLLRLRLGLGVGIKPDVLACLIGHGGASLAIQMLATATSYYPRAVRRAVEELSAAGFVDIRPTSPVSYRADNQKWSALLVFEADEPPLWRPWAQIYAFVTDLDRWSQNLPHDSGLVLASEARDLVTAHAPALHPAIRLPQTDRHPGEAYLQPFLASLEAVKEFVETVV